MLPILAGFTAIVSLLHLLSLGILSSYMYHAWDEREGENDHVWPVAIVSFLLGILVYIWLRSLNLEVARVMLFVVLAVAGLAGFACFLLWARKPNWEDAGPLAFSYNVLAAVLLLVLSTPAHPWVLVLVQVIAILYGLFALVNIGRALLVPKSNLSPGLAALGIAFCWELIPLVMGALAASARRA